MITLLEILQYLLTILTWIIIIQAVLSWLVAFNVINTTNDFVRSVLMVLDRITEPLYRPIRKIMPDFGALDLSPLVVLIVVSILNNIVLSNMIRSLAYGGRDILIDGKAHAAALRERVAAGVKGFTAKIGRAPGLAVVLVGDDPASAVYVRSKGKATLAAGMASVEHRLPAETTQADLLSLVARLNADGGIDGILVQLPLPPQIDEATVIAAVDPDKDVDGFHPLNAGRLASGLEGLVPCTPLGCLMLARAVRDDLSGLDAIVIGRSNIVGKPMAQLLLRASCTVTVAHSRTRELPAAVRRADIVVAAVGRAAMIRGDWIKPGATVIDVGINRVDGRLVGDVDFAAAAAVAGAITPVPGGVGPMTIAVLLRNALAAAHRRAGLALPEDLRCA